VRRVKVETLAYTPEARAALRFEVLAENKDTGLPELRRLVGKVQMRKPPGRLFAGHWTVWRRTLGRAAIAPPVGYVSTAQLSLQEFLNGERLSDLAGTGVFDGFARQAARTLAVVHSSVLPLLAQRNAEKEGRAVRRWTEVLSRLRPHLAGRLEHLQARLLSEICARLRISGTVHADFHLANVLADLDGVTIIDWDQVAHGDPMVDVGRFLGSLRVCALRVAGDPRALADTGESFLETYLRQRPDDVRRARLFESAALLIAAASPFRLQREGWEEAAEAMVEEAEQLLEVSCRGPAVTRNTPRGRAQISGDERAAWSLDPAYSQALLVPLVRQAHGSDIEVTECHPSLVTHTGDLLHVRWIVKGYRGRERWRGSVEGIGLAGHTGTGLLRRLTALRAATSKECLQLPRPLGQLAPLSLVAMEPCRGRSLPELLDGDQAPPILERLGRSMAALASTQTSVDKLRRVDRDLRAVACRLERLAADGRPEAARIGALLEEVQRRLRSTEPCPVAALHRLQLADLVVGEDGIAARFVRDVVLAPAHAAVGSLLAQLAQLSVRRGGRLPRAARLLRAAYCEAAGAPVAEVAAFEALQLLRRGCRWSLDRPDDERATALLDQAQQALSD
jgi:aminoglycoside phosphotransferase (APT) family kinase protein